MKKDAPLAFRIPADLKRKLLRLAKREARSVSQICEMLLSIGVHEYDKAGPNYLQKKLSQSDDGDQEQALNSFPADKPAPVAKGCTRQVGERAEEKAAFRLDTLDPRKYSSNDNWHSRGPNTWLADLGATEQLSQEPAQSLLSGRIPEGLNAVRVSVLNIPVEHSVKLQDFNAWLKKEGGSPRENSDRRRIREILGFVANKQSDAPSIRFVKLLLNFLQKAGKQSRPLNHVSRLPELNQAILLVHAAEAVFRHIPQQTKPCQAGLYVLFHVSLLSGLWPPSTSSKTGEMTHRVQLGKCNTTQQAFACTGNSLITRLLTSGISS